MKVLEFFGHVFGALIAVCIVLVIFYKVDTISAVKDCEIDIVSEGDRWEIFEVANHVPGQEYEMTYTVHCDDQIIYTKTFTYTPSEKTFNARFPTFNDAWVEGLNVTKRDTFVAIGGEYNYIQNYKETFDVYYTIETETEGMKLTPAASR